MITDEVTQIQEVSLGQVSNKTAGCISLVDERNVAVRGIAWLFPINMISF